MLSHSESLQASLNDLNQRLDAPISMNRFRPNIVLDGDQAPWAEDEWGKRKIRVQLEQGNAVDLELCKPCSRCTVSPFSNVHLAAGSSAYMPAHCISGMHTYAFSG